MVYGIVQCRSSRYSTDAHACVVSEKPKPNETKPNRTETETKKTFLSSAAQLSNRAIMVMGDGECGCGWPCGCPCVHVSIESMCIERALVHCPRNERNAIANASQNAGKTNAKTL